MICWLDTRLTLPTLSTSFVYIWTIRPSCAKTVKIEDGNVFWRDLGFYFTCQLNLIDIQWDRYQIIKVNRCGKKSMVIYDKMSKLFLINRHRHCFQWLPRTYIISLFRFLFMKRSFNQFLKIIGDFSFSKIERQTAKNLNYWQ